MWGRNGASLVVGVLDAPSHCHPQSPQWSGELPLSSFSARDLLSFRNQDRFGGHYEVGQGETVTILSRRDPKPELLLRDIHSKVVEWQYPIASLIIPLCAQQGTMSLELVETVNQFHAI